MKWFGGALFALTALGAAASSTIAMAAPVYEISDTGTIVDSSQWEYLNVAGIANVPAVGILFTVSSPPVASNPLLVLCDDLFQYVYVPEHYAPGQELAFDQKSLYGSDYYATGTAPGDEAAFTPQQASELGQLVNQAQGIWDGGGAPGAEPSFASGLNVNQSIAAIQGAMWNIEYGETVTSLDPNAAIAAEIDTAIGGYEAEFEHNYRPGALGLFSDPDGVQNQVLGFSPFSGGGGASPTPEPETWAMMLIGVFLVGAVMRRGRAPGRLKAVPAA